MAPIPVKRASISRTTQNKVEKGNPGVSLGHYATVLFVPGMVERLGDLADLKTDAQVLDWKKSVCPSASASRYSPDRRAKGDGS